MINNVFIGTGSNLGAKIKNCRIAIQMVDSLPDCRVTAQSDFFRTAPVGVEGHDWYVNAVFSIETELPPQDLLTHLLKVEKELGRQRIQKWDPRTIDLDILLYGSQVIDDKELKVPHPLMHSRKFVLVPMAQLAPDLLHPVLGKSIAELLFDLSEGTDQTVSLYKEVPWSDC